MNLNPVMWPLAAKIAGCGAVAVAVGGAAFGAVSAYNHPVPVRPVVAKPNQQTPAAGSPVASPASSGLLARCRVGSDNEPVSQQNFDTGGLDYLITVANDTSSAVTLTGYTVTFNAYGQAIDTENPTVGPALAEPSETWTYTGTYVNAPQVSESTYLDETCTVTEVDTPTGEVAPQSVSGQNGNANTDQQNIQDAQGQLQKDLSALSQDASGLPGDVSKISDDVTATDTDVAQTKSDAANGDGSECINASTTVYNDAATTVYNDVLTTAYNDVGTAGNDISAIRQLIGTASRTRPRCGTSASPPVVTAQSALRRPRLPQPSTLSTRNTALQQRP